MSHELKYLARAAGLTHLGITDNQQAHWYCTCRRWRMNRDQRGRPFRETAEKYHRKHVKEATR